MQGAERCGGDQRGSLRPPRVRVRGERSVDSPSPGAGVRGGSLRVTRNLGPRPKNLGAGDWAIRDVPVQGTEEFLRGSRGVMSL